MTDEQIAEALRLKHLDRAGWKRAGISSPESVAAHSWGVSLLVLACCPPTLDRERVLIMAILHDLAEVRVGDITPYDGVTKEEKHRRERVAIMDMLAGRPDLLSIWLEAEVGLTPEAIYVKEMDGLDLRYTAHHYQTEGFDVAEFLADKR